ncbi:MAG: hypothetical protein GY725_07965 [bacterium]|nr:hypothetical protein [bacterium]
MKNSKQTHSGDNATPIIGPIEIGGNAEWRRIELPESPRISNDAIATRQIAPEQRVHTNKEVSIAAHFSTIDPVRDAASGTVFFETSEEEVVLNVSRRGICLQCERAPAIGTRLLLELKLPGENTMADMVGRVCWTRPEYLKGEHGARAIAIVGIQLLGGSPIGLETYDRSIGQLLQTAPDAVASPEAVG